MRPKIGLFFNIQQEEIMSKIFKNTLKSFKSEITGEEREYSVNNAVWLFMDSLFDMDQAKFDKELTTNPTTAMAMFTTAILKANQLEVDYEEVLNNTSPVDVSEFYNNFFDIAFQRKVEDKKQKTLNQ